MFDTATLDELAAAIGAPVPDGDPEALFSLADQVDASARAWAAHADALQGLRSQLRSVLAGDTADAHDQALAELLSGPDSLGNDPQVLRAGATAVRDFAADLQANQWSSRLMAAYLLATAIWGAARAVASGGESLVEVAIARVRTAATINTLKTLLWQRIADILMELGVNAGRAALLGGAQQLAIQGLQIATGNRQDLNVDLIAQTGLSFAEYGLGEGAVEHGVMGLVGQAAANSPARSVATWAASKALSGMGGNTAATLAGGGPLTGETLLAGALMGGVGALADTRGHSPSVPGPTDNTPAEVPAGQPSTAVHHAPATPEGPPHLGAAAPNAPTADPAAGGGNRATGSPPDTAVAREGATASPGGSDSAAKPSNGSTAAATRARGVDTRPATNSSLGPRTPEGRLDLAPPAPVSVGPVVDAGSPAISELVARSGPAGLPTAMSDMARAAAPGPSSTPPASSDRGPNLGSPHPTPDARAGVAESASPARESTAQPPGAPPARTSDTAAAPHAGGVEPVKAGYAGANVIERAAQPIDPEPATTGRPGPHAHLLVRGDDSQRPADPLSTRRDPTRPNSTRADTNRPTGPRSATRDPLQRSDTRGGRRPRGDDLALIAARHQPDPNPGDHGDSNKPPGSSPRHEPPGIDLPQPVHHSEDHNGGRPSGHRPPDPVHGDNPDFWRRQAEYRAQDLSTRKVDTRNLEPLGDVVDSHDPQRLSQLAQDLSGMYGPYRIELKAREIEGAISLSGDILNGNERVGWIRRRYARDSRGNLVAHHIALFIEVENFRGMGFSKALLSEVERYYVRSDVDRIEIATVAQGGYVWARRGYTWDPDPNRLQASLGSIKDSADRLRGRLGLGAEGRMVLDGIVRRLNPDRPDLPEPMDLATLRTPDVPDLGCQLLVGTRWRGVKYLRGGAAADPAGDIRLGLAHNDAVDDVRGYRVDPDFSRRQEEYRAQDLSTRQVDTRYAEQLGELLNNASDPARIEQLAEDLSGMYGPYRIQLWPHEVEGDIYVTGLILRDETQIGTIGRCFGRDRQGNLVAYHNGLVIHDEEFRGKGFSKALLSALEGYYTRSGVDRIELSSHGKGSYAWARRGFTWDPDPSRLARSLDRIKASANTLRDLVSTEARMVLDEIVLRLDPEHPHLPEPIDLADLATPGEPDLGGRLLYGTSLNYVKYLHGDVAVEPTAQSQHPDPHPADAAADRAASPNESDHVDPANRLNAASAGRQDALGQRGGGGTGLAAGHHEDPEFWRRQAEYRAEDPTSRRADLSYAEPLDDVVDSHDPRRADQLAKDLSGRYGPYHIQLRHADEIRDEVRLRGAILSGDTTIGSFSRGFFRDSAGNLVVYNHLLRIDDEHREFRGKGFSKALSSEHDAYYVRCGVDRIELTSGWQGSYAWARQGYTWGPSPLRLRFSLRVIKVRARLLIPSVSRESQQVLRDIMSRLGPNHPRLPEPIDLANLATSREPNLGEILLIGTSLYMAKYLRERGAEESTTPRRNGFRAWLHRWFGSGGE